MSVDNIVAETPRLLAKGLQQTGLAQSGKLVVVKVSFFFFFIFIWQGQDEAGRGGWNTPGGVISLNLD